MSDHALQKQNERIERALKQTMFLISAQKNEKKWDFVVEGTRGINYDVCFSSKGMTCECPDFEKRGRNCKHMFFVIGRIAQMNLGKFESDQSDFNVFELFPNLIETLEKVLIRRLDTTHQDEILTSKDDCCVCFESMEKGSLVDCRMCKNLFHDSCMTQWLSNAARNNCPLCRTSWYKKAKTTNVLEKFVKSGVIGVAQDDNIT